MDIDRRRGSWTISLCGCLIFAVTGCRTSSHAENGALVGAGLGTLAGAVIGHQSGHGGSGAMIGAITGAMAGGLVGDAEDAREERDAALAHARYQEEAAYHAAKVAVSNLDLIDMSQAGLSERVIINAVETRGGQFDLSPSAIIELKRQGVSDQVILSIQQLNRGKPTVRPDPYTYSSPTIISPAPTRMVYVAPRPTIGVVIGARPSYRYHGHYGPYHRHHHHHRW